MFYIYTHIHTCIHTYPEVHRFLFQEPVLICLTYCTVNCNNIFSSFSSFATCTSISNIYAMWFEIHITVTTVP